MPSAQTGLAFIYAYTPTYTEGEYKIIEEMGQATEWKHYSKTFSVEGADGTFIFGFVSYAAEVRDQAMAIDNFKITEESAPGSVSEIAAGAAVTYHDGMLNVPADIESVAVYDMQGRMVISTTETGTITDHTNGKSWSCPPIPASMAEIVSKGGLVNYVKSRLGAE